MSGLEQIPARRVVSQAPSSGPPLRRRRTATEPARVRRLQRRCDVLGIAAVVQVPHAQGFRGVVLAQGGDDLGSHNRGAPELEKVGSLRYFRRRHTEVLSKRCHDGSDRCPAGGRANAGRTSSGGRRRQAARLVLQQAGATCLASLDGEGFSDALDGSIRVQIPHTQGACVRALP